MARQTGSQRPLLLLLLSVLGALNTASTATLSGHSLSNPGMPTIQKLDAKCGRSGMTVHITFDQPFPGVIYSKGHYADNDCNYVTEKTAGSSEYTFLVPINGCGSYGQLEESRPGRDMFFENTIIVQLDPLITEVWDEARLLKCVWPHTMLKRVRASPFEVYQPERVSVQLDERSINTLMQIQQGPGPFDSPATGYVYMGDDTSVVIYVQDPDHSVDANVVNCSATGVGGGTVQLLDDFGCLVRPDLITHFDKSRKTNGVKADLMLYSYLKAFRVGESPEFTIRCQLEVCRGKCKEPCSTGPVLARRRKRSTDLLIDDVVSFKTSRPDAILKTDRPGAILGAPGRASISEVPTELLNAEHDQDSLPKRVNLEQAVLVVEREEIETSESWCNLSPSIVAAGLVLLAIVAFLSMISCYLALKLAKHNEKNVN